MPELFRAAVVPMINLFTLLCLMGASTVARAEDVAQVSAVVSGKQLQLSSSVQHKLVEVSLRLLATCGYSNLHSTNQLADVERQSHLHFTFSQPRNVEVRVATHITPAGKFNVELKEMAITLPLSSGGFWVSSNQGMMYFAKFDCKTAGELEKILKGAQEPWWKVW